MDVVSLRLFKWKVGGLGYKEEVLQLRISECGLIGQTDF
ncbi:hypothetical protein D1BOALGB6SA_1647 [Olavius sp. associated proteobacterium Delta 1]|nr:hypothetical protein D1BOALGB6SA_1647 [Olavius sp. associated proteobacterium Delta 1]